ISPSHVSNTKNRLATGISDGSIADPIPQKLKPQLRVRDASLIARAKWEEQQAQQQAPRRKM
ncbi:hypothetical protein E4U52_000612, partial [Claviceps spartinae]